MLGCQEVCHEHYTSGDNAEAAIINASDLDVTDQSNSDEIQLAIGMQGVTTYICNSIYIILIDRGRMRRH